MNMKKNFLTMLLALALCSSTFAQWKPAGDKIKTSWGEQLDPKTYCRNIRVLSWSATTGKT